ncbi:MAG: xanthine dehydrogenase family protein molybdopterin-binding subunit, partial [Alphaproteobacteria bacterium]|nr:xanthine dehydrogenase family protein molybdopterin-binding subunit [Alphaproteobacteria bacterium]
EYWTAPQHHNAIELFSTTAIWEGGRLTVYEPSQGLYGMRYQLARQLGLDPADVRIVSSYVGGGFGGKGPLTPRTAIVALAARRLGRPVRCVVTRKEGYTTAPYRAETRHRIRMAANLDGKLTGYSHHGWELTSRTDNYVTAGTEEVARLYAYGTVWTKVDLVKADRQTPAYMRAPHEVPYCFALESAMDEMAAKLGIDPIEFRRRNDTAVDPISGSPYSTRSLMKCFDAASEAFGWACRDPRPCSLRDGDWLIGCGCAAASYPANLAAAAARVRLTAGGRASVQSAVHEIGTGTCTVLAQIAAERLGIDVEDVDVEFGDTNFPPAPIAGGTVTTASVGTVVLMACDGIKRKLFEMAGRVGGPLAGRRADRMALSGGSIRDADGAWASITAVLESASVGSVEEYAEYVPPGSNPTSGQALHRGRGLIEFGSRNRDKTMFALGAELVEVRVHALTGEIRVPRMVGAFAGGRVVNPRTARSQLMGGMIWGMSAGLLEATDVDERNARYVNADLHDYYVPVCADIDQVEVQMLSEIDRDVNPAGIKGLGEIGVSGTNAAIANALYHATGKRVRKAPIRLEDLLG